MLLKFLFWFTVEECANCKYIEYRKDKTIKARRRTYDTFIYYIIVKKIDYNIIIMVDF